MNTDVHTTVLAAARNGQLEDIKKLICDGRPVDGCDNRGWRPTHEAAYGNYTACLQLLLDQEHTRLDWQSYEGATALLLACQCGHEDSVKILLEAGANPNIADNMDNFPLHEAVKTQKLSVVRLLVEHGANVNCQLYCGTSPLHQSVSEGMADITRYLIQNGGSLETQEEYNITPVFSAAQYGQAECLELLLDHAKSQGKQHLVNHPAEDGATPLFLAAQEGSVACVRLLLQHGADPNIMTNTEPRALPVLPALEFGHLEVVSALLPVTDQVYFKDCNNSPWYFVLAFGDLATKTEMVRLMLEHGVDANYMHTRDMEDNFTRFPKILRFLPTESMLFLKCVSPLSLSAIYEHQNSVSELVHLLIAHGACVNARRPYEYPPLLPALEGRKLGLVRVLVQAGASIHLYHPKLQGNYALLLCMHQWRSFNLLLKLGAEVESLFDEAKYFHCLEQSNQRLASQDQGGSSEEPAATQDEDPEWSVVAGGSADQVPGSQCNNEDRQLAILESISFISFATFLVGARHVMSASPYKVSVSQALYKLLYFARNVPFSEHFMSFLDSQKDRADIRSLTETPRTLAHLCRLSIRQALGTKRILNETETRTSFHLPTNIWDFVFFSEISY